MQPCLFIIILVLKSERLMRVLVNPLILFQTTPGGVFALPQQIAMDVGHLAWCADVVGAEIGEVFILLCFGCCGRLWLGGGSLCRCTPEVIDCRPRRNGYVSGRCSPMPVCLGVLWRTFVRTGRRRMPRSQGGCQLDKICC